MKAYQTGTDIAQINRDRQAERRKLAKDAYNAYLDGCVNGEAFERLPEAQICGWLAVVDCLAPLPPLDEVLYL